MLYFIRKYRALLFATALLFSGLVILTSTHENRRDLGFLDKLALDVTGFFAGLLTGVGGGISGLWFDYVYLVGVRAENEALRAEVDRMKLERAALEEAVLETDRLRRVLGYRERTGFTALPATVIGSDVSGWFRTITIDRGSTDGVERGMAVVSPDGVVGRTHEVASRTTKVLLVSDANSAVDAILQRTRGRGVVYGRVTAVLEMRYVHRTEDVAEGDLVVTSGVGGVFPKGLPVGVVARVDDTATGLFKTVDVAPLVDLSRLEEVLVVTTYPARDYEPIVAPVRAPAAEPTPDPLPATGPAASTAARPTPTPARPTAPAPARATSTPTRPTAPAPARATSTPARPTAPAPARATSTPARPTASAPAPAPARPASTPAQPVAPSPLPAREQAGGPSRAPALPVAPSASPARPAADG